MNGPAPLSAFAGQNRNRAMDIARGFAVMGILLMNIIAFAMPDAAYINPTGWGDGGVGDRIVWFVTFVLIDGKMRGLFALLFGASMLLMMDRTEMTGGDGRHRHIIRSFWLALIGFAHYLLLWWGDILLLYALIGMAALPFAGKQPLALVKLAFLAFAFQLVLLVLLMIGLYQDIAPGLAPNASAEAIQHTAKTLSRLGQPGSRIIADQIGFYLGPWHDIVAERERSALVSILSGINTIGLEVLGFMLLGMAMLKGGFLSGGWPRENYIATARHCFLIGLPPMIALGIWAWVSDFAAVTTFGIVLAWSFPFRIPLTVGWAALIYAVILSHQSTPLLVRIEATGRMALSNYLGTSLMMTALFYGWGLDLFGSLSRLEVYAIVPVAWIAMLLWSPLWLRYFRYGPVEWVWRSLTLFSPQPLKR